MRRPARANLSGHMTNISCRPFNREMKLNVILKIYTRIIGIK
jgi:hypothetical protein